MKKLILLAAILFLAATAIYAQDFITQWHFPTATNQVRFYAETQGTVNYTWTCSPSGNSGSWVFQATVDVLVTISGLNVPAGQWGSISITDSVKCGNVGILGLS